MTESQEQQQERPTAGQAARTAVMSFVETGDRNEGELIDFAVSVTRDAFVLLIPALQANGAVFTVDNIIDTVATKLNKALLDSYLRGEVAPAQPVQQSDDGHGHIESVAVEDPIIPDTMNVQAGKEDAVESEVIDVA